MKRSEIAELLMDMAASKPHFKPPDPERTFRVYAEDLEDLPDDALRYAFRQLRREGGNYFPTIPEIRKTARNYSPQLSEGELYWLKMEQLGAALRGQGKAPGLLPQGVTTEWDDLTPEELERLADEKAGYRIAEPEAV